MVGQALDVCSGISFQAGPVEMDDHTLSGINMRTAVRLIGRQLAQIGDELDNNKREKLAHPNHLQLQVYPNMLIWRAMNRRLVGSLHWSKLMSMLRASGLVPQLHTLTCQKWISLVKAHVPASGTKYVLVSAFLLMAAAIFTTPWNN